MSLKVNPLLSIMVACNVHNTGARNLGLKEVKTKIHYFPVREMERERGRVRELETEGERKTY
jgi:hypothetical protein